MLKISVVSKCQQSCSFLIKAVQLFSVVRRVFDSLAAGTAYKTSSVGFSRNPSWASDSRCATGHCRQFSRRRWGMVASHTPIPTLYLPLSVSLSFFVCVCMCMCAWGSRVLGEQGNRGPDVRALIQYFWYTRIPNVFRLRHPGLQRETPETCSGSWSRALRRLAGGGR